MATTINCQWCGQRMSIGDGAPKVLTCPRCLSKIRNPELNPPPLPAPREAPPRPVIPLEEQVHTDHRAASAIVLLICVVLAAGITMLFMSGLNFGNLFVLAVLVPTVLAITVAFRVRGADDNRRQEFVQTLNSISRVLGAIMAVFMLIGGILLLVFLGICAGVLKGI